jgi:hypothetical protein
MRQLIRVRPTTETKITYPEITLADAQQLGAMLDENTEVTKVKFSTKENTSDVVRCGVQMEISKRYTKGNPSVFYNHILDNMPDMFSGKTRPTNFIRRWRWRKFEGDCNRGENSRFRRRNF